MSSPDGIAVAALGISAELGGTERVLLDLAPRAPALGVDLTVVLPRRGPLTEELDRAGVPIEIVPATPRLLAASQRRLGRDWPGLVLLPVWLLAWHRALARTDVVRRADIVYPVGFKPYLAAARLGRHCVWHLHEFPPHPWWKWLRRRLADRSLANSAAVAAAWSAGTDPSLQVVLNGVDLDRFRPRPASGWLHRRLGLAPSARLVGMPGVFARWKGQLEVIRAFAQVAGEAPDAHLAIIGGPLYDTVAEREYAAELHHAVQVARTTQIHLTGFVPDIHEVYPELHAVVHYSLRPEPFGRVIVESMACGVPVLAADEGGPREIVLNGQTGWLVAPRSTPALAQALRTALTLPEAARAALAGAARLDAERRFSADRFAREVAEVLRLARPTASPSHGV